MKLLMSQKNELFDLIENNDFSPVAFELSEDQNYAYIDYKGTDFEFVTSYSGGRWSIKYSPGFSRYTDSFAVSGWYEVRDHFTKWLVFLKREISQVDKWQRLGDEVKQINIIYSSESEKFSASEYEDLKIKMNQLKERIKELDLLPEQLKVLENKIDHLTALAVNLGKYDWKNLFIGTIISIIIQLSVNQENAKMLWELIRKIFSTYFLP